MHAATLERFLEAPIGRYYRGETTLVFCHQSGLFGSFSHGYRTHLQTLEILRCYGALLDFGPRLLTGIVDASGITGLSDECLTSTAQFFADIRDRAQGRCERVALLPPPGAMGALFAGTTLVSRPHFELRCFVERDAAIAWLDADATIIATMLAELGPSPLLAAARRELRQSPRTTIAGLSRRLGLSVRSLQRGLAQHHTDFRRESHHAKVAKAAECFMLGEDKVATVARAVGCSVTTLTALFRSQLGVSPAAYRGRIKSA